MFEGEKYPGEKKKGSRGGAEWAGSGVAVFFFFFFPPQECSGKVPPRRQHLNKDLPELEGGSVRISGGSVTGKGQQVQKAGASLVFHEKPGGWVRARRAQEEEGRSGVSGARLRGLIGHYRTLVLTRRCGRHGNGRALTQIWK